MKRTFQPNVKKRKKNHGFRVRMQKKSGRAVIANRRRKGRKKISAWGIEERVKIKFETLKKKSDFDRVIREGIYRKDKYLIIYIFKRAEVENSVRAGFGIGKKVGGAVLRNRIKRVLKEILKKTSIEIKGGLDILIIAKKETAGIDFWELKGHLESNLKSILID